MPPPHPAARFPQPDFGIVASEFDQFPKWRVSRTEPRELAATSRPLGTNLTCYSSRLPDSSSPGSEYVC
jgi:hypothetical protein